MLRVKDTYARAWEILMSWLALPDFTLAFLALALLKAKWRES
jgi:hypothetical protein